MHTELKWDLNILDTVSSMASSARTASTSISLQGRKEGCKAEDLSHSFAWGGQELRFAAPSPNEFSGQYSWKVNRWAGIKHLEQKHKTLDWGPAWRPQGQKHPALCTLPSQQTHRLCPGSLWEQRRKNLPPSSSSVLGSRQTHLWACPCPGLGVPGPCHLPGHGWDFLKQDWPSWLSWTPSILFWSRLCLGTLQPLAKGSFLCDVCSVLSLPSCDTAHMHRPVTQNFSCASSTQISLPCSFLSCFSGSACDVWSCRAVGLGFWLETMSRIPCSCQRSSVFPRHAARLGAQPQPQYPVWNNLEPLGPGLAGCFLGFFTHLLPQGMIWSLLRWICTAGRGEGDVWMPYSRKGDEDQEGKERKASTRASSHLNPKKKCDPEPLSAQDTCWTAPTSLLSGWELKDVFFSGAPKNMPQNLLLSHPK